MGLIHKKQSTTVKTVADSYADYVHVEYAVTLDGKPEAERRIACVVHKWGAPARGYDVQLESLIATGPRTATATVSFRYPLGE